MMKNFRRFLVTFAMLFVIVLTTACSNKGTDNENKKEDISVDNTNKANVITEENLEAENKIKALDKESVEAKFQNFDTPATVIYKFACDDKQCQITDLLEEDQETHKPKSFKEGLANCLADLEKSASAK